MKVGTGRGNPPPARYSARNFSTRWENSAGFSRQGKWPHWGMMSRRAPGIHALEFLRHGDGVSASCSPHSSRVGAFRPPAGARVFRPAGERSRSRCQWWARRRVPGAARRHRSTRSGVTSRLSKNMAPESRACERGWKVQVHRRAAHPASMPAELLSTRRSTLSGDCSARAAMIHPPSEWPSSDARGTAMRRQEAIEHLDEGGDAIWSRRLVGAAEAEQFDGDHAMRGAQRLPSRRPTRRHRRRVRAPAPAAGRYRYRSSRFCGRTTVHAAQLRQRWEE